MHAPHYRGILRYVLLRHSLDQTQRQTEFHSKRSSGPVGGLSVKHAFNSIQSTRLNKSLLPIVST